MPDRRAKPPATPRKAAGIRNEKHDALRKDSPEAPKSDGAPVRDTRESPAPNPDGEGPGSTADG